MNQDSAVTLIIGMRAAKKAIELALHVPFLQDEKPVGMFLLAAPGTGKSTLLTRFISDHQVIVNDMTGRGLEELCKEMANRKAGVVVIPDLLRLMARPRGWQAFQTLANIVLEEGLEGIKRFDVNLKFSRPVNFGILTAMTVDAFRASRRFLERSGFLSRFGVFAFKYEAEDQARIESLIAGGDKTDEIKYLISPKELTEVKIPAELSEQVRFIGKTCGNGKSPHFRSIKFMRRLMKANALMNGRTEINQEDLGETYALCPFFVPPDDTSSDLDYLLLKQNQSAEAAELVQTYSTESIQAARTRLLRKQFRF
jgi:hypothetical protein